MLFDMKDSGACSLKSEVTGGTGAETRVAASAKSDTFSSPASTVRKADWKMVDMMIDHTRSEAEEKEEGAIGR